MSDEKWQQMLRGYAELKIDALCDDEKMALSPQMFRASGDVATALKAANGCPAVAHDDEARPLGAVAGQLQARNRKKKALKGSKFVRRQGGGMSLYEERDKEDEQDLKYEALPLTSQAELERAIDKIIAKYGDDVECVISEWTQVAVDDASLEVARSMKALRAKWGNDLVEAALRLCDDTLAANPNCPEDRSIREVEEEMQFGSSDAA